MKHQYMLHFVYTLSNYMKVATILHVEKDISNFQT